MTQDVQPLTWQKRTNLEEHQQFFSKINEIIDNLAPTVDEAEAAIAQATAAIASANDAIATANAASAAASAAASQAQTAASTVAGYDTRLTAAEGDIDAAESDIAALQGRMGTAEGNITSLDSRMAAAESKNSQQDTAIATLQTADMQNVKINRINDYAVGLTGSQQKSGTIEFMTPLNPIKLNCSSLISGIQIKNTADDSAVTPTSNMGYSQMVFKDMNDVTVGYLRFQHKRTGGYVMSIGTRNSSGVLIDTVIADVS